MSKPVSLPNAAFCSFGPLFHRPLQELQNDGCEPAVLRRMQEELIGEHIHRCHARGEDPVLLSPEETLESVREIWYAKTHMDEEGPALVSYDGTDAFYESTRQAMQRQGPLAAERTFEHALASMRTLQEKSAQVNRTVQQSYRNGYLNCAVIAASHARIAGLEVEQLIARFRADSTLAANREWLDEAGREIESNDADVSGAIPPTQRRGWNPFKR